MLGDLRKILFDPAYANKRKGFIYTMMSVKLISVLLGIFFVCMTLISNINWSIRFICCICGLICQDIFTVCGNTEKMFDKSMKEIFSALPLEQFTNELLKDTWIVNSLFGFSIKLLIE